MLGKSIYFVFVDRFARDEGFPGVDVCMSDRTFCGGTLRGITNHLDYIEGMGFDCLWITPVVQQPEGLVCNPNSGTPPMCGTGYHGYWAQDFYAIDPHFGTADDLLKLSRALKARGMCLMLDVVVNHVRPVNSLQDLELIYPFNQTTDYHTYHAQPGESFSSYLQHPYLCLPPPHCGVGEYKCNSSGKLYDEHAIQQGWFYDLADLNQEQPRVEAELLRWGRLMVSMYEIDAIRLDTASYMRLDFIKRVYH